MKAKEATYRVLDKRKKGDRFTGYQLTLEVKAITGVLHYPDTMLRYLRTYRRTTGRMIVNVDKARSIYEIIT